jgi:ABC-type transport system involved in multi-copper enzyme maturation permease subunit
MTGPRAAGTIYDLGYQRYDGDRMGRLHTFRTLFRFSAATAFGIGRGDRAKFVPVIVGAVVYLPAFVQIGLASETGLTGLVNYARHLEFTTFLIALFAAAQAPEILVTDRQHGTLSLYLSRPMRATDYALAKLFALLAALLVLTLGPQLVLFLGKVLLAEAPWTAFQGEWKALGPILGGTVMAAAFMASIALGIASFTTRRAYASAGVIAYFLFMPAAAQMLRAATEGDVRRYAVLAHPMLLITGFTRWLFDVQASGRRSAVLEALPGEAYLYGMLAWSLGAAAVLLIRYHRSEP